MEKLIPQKARILFLHIPQKMRHSYNINYMPMGFFALADLLAKKGFKVEMINYLIERVIDKDFDLIDYIRKKKIKIICADLHWHFQIYDVIRNIKKIKKQCRDVKIILGGYTASYYAQDIMRQNVEVDYIIRGEAEKPLLQLIRYLHRPGDGFLENIPNLVWRGGNSDIKINSKMDILLSEKGIDKLEYTGLRLLRNYDLYLRFQPLGYQLKSRFNFLANKEFMLNTGRGCPVQCFYCGGGKKAQKIITGRRCFKFRSHERVINDIDKLVKYGVKVVFFDYDPDPKGNYYKDLFDKMGRKKFDIAVHYVSWALPSRAIIKAMYNNSPVGGRIVISPDQGDEEKRRKNKGFYYSNDELFKTLDYIEENNRSRKNKIYVHMYFFIGAPDESEKDLIKTKEIIEKTLHYNCVDTICTQYPMLEPGSAMLLSPEKYGIRLLRKNYSDFYRFSKYLAKLKGVADVRQLMGYIPAKIGLNRLVSIKGSIDQLINRNIMANNNVSYKNLVGLSENSVIRPCKDIRVIEYVDFNKNGSRCDLYQAKVNLYNEFPISKFEADLIRAIDGKKSVGELFFELTRSSNVQMKKRILQQFISALRKLIMVGIYEIAKRN